jgi:hypothetical protein
MGSEEGKPYVTAKQLCAKYGLDAEHSLYRSDGTWYHVLKQFPGILFDKNGFIRFSNHEDFAACAALKVYVDTDQVAVPDGISKIPGYTTFDSLRQQKQALTQEISSDSGSVQQTSLAATEIGIAVFLDPMLTFAASSAFMIVGEIIQRVSSSLRVYPRITFPCGGFYHAVSLIVGGKENIADFSLTTGRFHPHRSFVPAAEQWPEPRSYCLAAVGRGYGVNRVANEILTALALPTVAKQDRSVGIAYQAIGMLLGRFIQEEGITIENGYRTGDEYPDWINSAPEDWRGETFDDLVAGQLWRVNCEFTSRSVIIDDCVDSAFLVEQGSFIQLSADTRSAVDMIERFLRAES